MKGVDSHEAWVVYFAYLPTGRLLPHHLFTITRLRDSAIPLFIVCAAPSVRSVPSELLDLSDALYWKALSGYDFSAYTIALEAIAKFSPHATAAIFNDSMLGPFTDIRPFIDYSPWDLTGFTATGLGENHIQSYGFVLRRIGAQRLKELRRVFFRRIAFSHVDPVISLQELRLARIASQHMRVGAIWYADGCAIDDACLRFPFSLVENGHPFVKRSLLGKMSHFQDRAKVKEFLLELGHPQIW